MKGSSRALDSEMSFCCSRNRENGEPIYPTSLQQALRLPAGAVLYESREEAESSLDMKALTAAGDPWPENPTSLRNFALQLRSIAVVTRLWLRRAASYRFVLYLRPDVLFDTDLDLPRLAPTLREYTIATPAWHQWGGLNDRFAFGAPIAMMAYALRGARIPEYVCGGRKPHSESFLAWYFEQQGLENMNSSVVFRRVRAGGLVEDDGPEVTKEPRTLCFSAHSLGRLGAVVP